MEMVGRPSEGSMSMSLTVSILSCEPAASAAEGGVGTSSSSMGDGTSRLSDERFTCGWRWRTWCLVPVRTCIGRTPERSGGRMGVGTLFVCCMRVCQGLLGSLPGSISSGDWENGALLSAMSSSPEDMMISCGLPGSDVMNDWSSLSYLGFWYAWWATDVVGVFKTESCGQELLSPEPGRALYHCCQPTLDLRIARWTYLLKAKPILQTNFLLLIVSRALFASHGRAHDGRIGHVYVSRSPQTQRKRRQVATI